MILLGTIGPSNGLLVSTWKAKYTKTIPKSSLAYGLLAFLVLAPFGVAHGHRRDLTKGDTEAGLGNSLGRRWLISGLLLGSLN